MNSVGFAPGQTRALRVRAEEQYDNLRGARFYRNLDFVLYLMTVVLVAFGIRTFLAEPIRVDGDSMIPTLTNHEHMFVEKVSGWFREPARGEIIICFYPGYTESCVKRVIALPGETISISGGVVYINGEKLNESAYWNDVIYNDTEPVTVGEKQVFVMGDNRNGSKDSRSPAVGCIPYSEIVGRVRAVIWPFGNWRAVRLPAYDYGN